MRFELEFSKFVRNIHDPFDNAGMRCPDDITLGWRGDGLLPCNNNGLVLTRAEWKLIKGLVDKGYEKVQDLEIYAHNMTIERDWEELQRPRPKAVTMRRKQPGYIYVLKTERGEYKIGKAKDPDRRLSELMCKLPFAADILFILEAEDMHEAEAELHEHFEDKRLNGEWFALTQEDIDWLEKQTTAVKR